MDFKEAEAKAAYVSALALAEIGEAGQAEIQQAIGTLEAVRDTEPDAVLEAKRDALKLIDQRISEARKSLKAIQRGEDEAELARLKLELVDVLKAEQELNKQMYEIEGRYGWTRTIDKDRLHDTAKKLSRLCGGPWSNFL